MLVVKHLHVQTLIYVRVCVNFHFLSYKTNFLAQTKKSVSTEPTVRTTSTVVRIM